MSTTLSADRTGDLAEHDFVLSDTNLGTVDAGLGGMIQSMPEGTIMTAGPVAHPLASILATIAGSFVAGTSVACAKLAA